MLTPFLGLNLTPKGRVTAPHKNVHVTSHIVPIACVKFHKNWSKCLGVLWTRVVYVRKITPLYTIGIQVLTSYVRADHDLPDKH